MADSKTLGSINTLDTSYFKETADDFKKAIDSFKESKRTIQSTTDALLDVWQGEARNIFESKYKLFIGKIGDLEETLIDYYNALLDSEMAYKS